MNLIFCGTPHFAVPTLEALIAAGHNVTLALSQPDRPVGRNAEVHPTPVKAAALAHGIPVEQPEKIKANEPLRAQLEAIHPDAIIVVAYGRILPQWMLDLPKYGCLNGHGSLLPRWRGAAPIQWAIAAGDTETGVTTMRLDAGLDTGAMLLKRAVPITPQTTSPDLFTALANLGADLMVETLAGLDAGTIQPQAQNETLATHAPILTRDDGLIDWSRAATEIDQRFRGFQPWPGAFTTLRGKKLIVHSMRVGKTTGTGQSEHATDRQPGIPAAGQPGEIVSTAETLTVRCGGNTTLHLDEVQLEGKKRMPATDFMRGFQIKSGERLG